MMRSKALACALGLVLAGCGGGGGGGAILPTLAPVSEVALLPAYAAWYTVAGTTGMTVSGDCTGTASFTRAAPANASFEGQAVFAIFETLLFALSGSCPVAPPAQTQSTIYVNGNRFELGVSYSGGSYGVAPSALALPALTFSQIGLGGDFSSWQLSVVTTPASGGMPPSVTATAAGPLGTITLWADASKTSQVGSITESGSFSMTSGASFATLVITDQIRDAGGSVVETVITTWQLNPDGTLTLRTIDLNYSGSTPHGHLLLTAN